MLISEYLLWEKYTYPILYLEFKLTKTALRAGAVRFGIFACIFTNSSSLFRFIKTTYISSDEFLNAWNKNLYLNNQCKIMQYIHIKLCSPFKPKYPISKSIRFEFSELECFSFSQLSQITEYIPVTTIFCFLVFVVQIIIVWIHW